MSEIAKSENATSLALPSIAALQAAAYAPENMAGVFGSRAGFLPRLQFMTSNTEQIKDGSYEGLNTYALCKQKVYTNLGKTILYMPIAWRAKAMFLKSDPPLAYHKQTSPEFIAIRDAANANSNSGNIYGPEFLVWVDGQGYATFYFASKTARNEAPNLAAFLPGPDGVLKTVVGGGALIESKDYKWWGTTTALSSQKIPGPPLDTYEMVVREFLTPIDSVPKPQPVAAPASAVVADR